MRYLSRCSLLAYPQSGDAHSSAIFMHDVCGTELPALALASQRPSNEEPNALVLFNSPLRQIASTTELFKAIPELQKPSQGRLPRDRL